MLQPRQANSVFASMPAPVVDGLHGCGWKFYDFALWGGFRLMCSWDTTPEDVSAFAADIRRLCGSA